jgi:hypothetical protein
VLHDERSLSASSRGAGRVPRAFETTSPASTSRGLLERNHRSLSEQSPASTFKGGEMTLYITISLVIGGLISAWVWTVLNEEYERPTLWQVAGSILGFAVIWPLLALGFLAVSVDGSDRGAR